MTKALIMRVGQPPETVELDWPDNPGYQRIAAFIEPLIMSDLEHVTVLADLSGGTDYVRADMFVDEHGGEKGLPRNPAATEIYRRATMLGRSGAPTPHDAEELPWIAGTAILFDRIVWR